PVLSGDPTGVHVYRSTNAAGPYSQLAALPLDTVEYSDSGLVNGDTYFYRLTSFRPGAESPNSIVFPGVPRDAVSPQGVASITGELQSAAFDVTWSPNPFNADGSAMTDLRQYRVYRSSAIEAVPTVVGLMPAAGPFAFSDPGGAALAPEFYFVRAEDTSGNESIDSLWIRSPSPSAPMEAFSVSPDRAAVGQIPRTGVDTLGQDAVVLQWTRHPEEENGRVAVSYTVQSLKSNGAKTDKTYALPPHTHFTFRYSAAGG